MQLTDCMQGRLHKAESNTGNRRQVDMQRLEARMGCLIPRYVLIRDAQIAAKSLNPNGFIA